MRGYFGLALYEPKYPVNFGTLIRTAHSMGASFISVIGARWKRHKSDTTNAIEHVPIFHYKTFGEFQRSLPPNCQIVAVEIDKNAELLGNKSHPRQACYLMGAEDIGIPQNVLKKCDRIIKLDTKFCLNVAVAGSIVLYHREAL